MTGPAGAAGPTVRPADGDGTALLDAHLVAHRGAFTLDLPLRAEPGEVLALLGPNGAGKTTALRILAGLLPLSGGYLRVDGRTLDDPDRGAFVAPQHRPAGVVFQDYLLFPHLSALDNVAFGPRCHGAGRAEARRIAAGWLDRVGLAGHHRARPRQLSGGQAQRVALARALALDPRLLLLDEPLAALDAGTRQDIRVRLGHHLAAHPGVAVLVTHDPLDAMVLADRIVVVESGRIVQQGSPAEITAHPRSDYVARLVGLNLYRGVADGSRVTLPGGPVLTIDQPARGPVFLAFRPAAVAIFTEPATGSPRNIWPATVRGLERHGDNIRVHLDGPLTAVADVTAAAATDLRLQPGCRVWAAVKATDTHAYPA